MHRRGRGIAVALVCTAATVGSGACGGSQHPGGAGRAEGRTVELRLVGGVDASALRADAVKVGDRLRRLGVVGVTTTVHGRAIRVEAPTAIDAFALEAAARSAPVVVRPLTKVTSPPCRVPSTPRAPAVMQSAQLVAPALGNFCFAMGPGIALGRAVSRAEAVTRPSLGWTVALTLVAPVRAHLPAAAAALGARDVALVAGDDVISRFVWSAGVPSLQSRIEGNFSEWEARRVAAALAVTDSLTSRFVVPRPSVPPGPVADVDVWEAALGVNVCGHWLRNAPSFAGSGSAGAGLHSHGDGLVSIHPYTNDEAGTRATLGRYFADGGWKLASGSIAAWDGVVHRVGDQCPDGGVADVRYTVDGVERRGDPAALRLENRMVIAVAFVPHRAQIGAPPQAELLRQPRWVPATP